MRKFIVTNQKEMDSILKQNNIMYDCIEANENYVIYQVLYFDYLKNFVGIATYKYIVRPFERSI